MDLITTTEHQLKELTQRVERALDYWLPTEKTHPHSLHEAMRYAVFNGGKRIRPALVYATAIALDIELDELDETACAIELIHTYSLIHDDLPAMDNDDLRRGKATCHKAYDEATAILAGDAMQALAFYLLARTQANFPDPKALLNMIETLAQAAGSRGMAGGQAIDLASVGRTLNLAELEDMHIHKTGALIRASVIMPAICKREIGRASFDRLDHFAKCIGLAFQIQDDILDVEGDTATLGKPQGSDHQQNKPTYPALMGLEEAKARALALHDDAQRSLNSFDERADSLRNIATYIVKRKK